MKVLLSFAGFHDPFAASAATGEMRAGPILTVVAERAFDRVYLFTTPKSAEISEKTAEAIAERHPGVKVETFVKFGGRVGIGIWLLLMALLALPLLALLWLPFPWWQGAGVMLIVSAITYGMYADDKSRAVSSGWRVPETTLHLAELLGGWPGALLAQRRLRHKCSKTSYQFVFWSIVILFQIAAVDVILGQRLSRAFLAFMIQ